MRQPDWWQAMLGNLRRQPNRAIALQRYARLAGAYEDRTVGIQKVRRQAIDRLALQPGETVFAIGTPLEIDLQGTLSRGIVSAIRHRDGELLIQSDVSIAHGNSGGPLLDEKGNVIGMTVSGLENTTANLNFFIPVAEILKALNLKLGG